MPHSPSTRKVRPTLETLDARIVPATLIDLTSQGAEGTANGAILREYNRADAHGTSHSFLQIKHNGVEQGYNTDARQKPFDDVRSGTRSIRLNQIPTVTIDGVSYRVFLLDINEPNNAATLSLDEFRIYASQTHDLSGYDAHSKKLGGQSPIFDLDAAGDVTVKLDARLNHNGKGDAFVLIPNSAFAGRNAAHDYVTLYSKLGSVSPANGGKEEWSVGRVPKTPAAPASGNSISGYVFEDDNGNQAFDPGIPDQGIRPELTFDGVKMELVGTDDLGNPVDMFTTTKDGGFYEFTNLRPGTYSVIELTQPTINSNNKNVLDGANIAGNRGGVAQDYYEGDSENPAVLDGIMNIVLATGQSGTNYNFSKFEDTASGS